MVNSQFVTDSELNTWINLGYQELYDLVVAAYEDYFTTSAVTVLTSGDTIALPTDFYKLRALDFNTGGNWTNCREFQFNERNQSNGSTHWLYGNTPARSYRILGDSLIIQPTAAASGTYKLWYVPSATLLTLDSSVIPNSLAKFGWDEYVVLYAAERMLSKEESSITDVVNERGEIAGRIKKMAQDRQIDQSSTIQDVQGSTMNKWGGWYD